MKSNFKLLQLFTVTLFFIPFYGTVNAAVSAGFQCLTIGMHGEELSRKEILDKRLACLRSNSELGDGEATWFLSTYYEKGSQRGAGCPCPSKTHPLGLVKEDEAESVRLKLLAVKQGAQDAKLWYLSKYIPPKPYKWEIGMSKNQVRNSIDGEPSRIIKTTTEHGATEAWLYTGATLFFGDISENFGSLKMIQENN